MWKKIILALLIAVLGGGIAFFVYKSEPKLNKNFSTSSAFFKNHPFRLGLDLSGGRAKCGKDLSEVIKQSPHGKSKLKLLKEIGPLQQ
jgi:hypothetical protein